LPLLEWTIVRLVVSENDGRRHNSEMEPQGRTIDTLFHTQRQSKTLCLEKTTLRVSDYVQTVGLNAETKKGRHRAEGEKFVLTFPLIGLFRFPDSGVDRTTAIRCHASMLKRLWQRIVERHRRKMAELEQIGMDMAKEEARFPLLPPFPQKPYKASTIVLFAVFGCFVAVAAGLSCAELLLSLFH
jgi:hypothetical protein